MTTKSIHNRYAQMMTIQGGAVLNAILIFKLLPNQWAGLWAGSVFCLTQAIISWAQLKSLLGFKSFSLWLGIFNLAVFSVPLLGTRLLHWGVDFKTLSVWGQPSGVIHHASETAYLIWIACTALDWFLHHRQLYRSTAKSLL